MLFRLLPNNNKFTYLIGVFVAFAGFGITLLIRPSWPGAMVRYDLMALALNAMLVVGLIKRREVGFLFLNLVIWIAFFLRPSLKVLSKDQSWQEPTGRFNFSQAAWDEVAAVVTVGALALFFVGLLFPSRRDQLDLPRKTIQVDGRMRLYAYSAIVSTTIILVASNEFLGIVHAGLRPAIDLPSPIQGAAVWLITIAPMLGLLILFHIDVISRRPLWAASFLFIIFGIAISYSTASRGAFIIQGLALIAVLILNKNQIPWLNNKRLVSLVIIFLFGFVLSILLAQKQRADNLPGYDSPIKQKDTGFIQRLIIDRWIGLEGLMATASYPEKNINLLIETARESRTKNSVDSFTKEISQSGFTDISRYQYATLPGGFAFLYLSGSLWIVFLGAAFFAMLVIMLEVNIAKYTGNLFLAGNLSVFSAMIFSQMGVGLIQQMSVLVFTFIAAVIGSFVAGAIFQKPSK